MPLLQSSSVIPESPFGAIQWPTPSLYPSSYLFLNLFHISLYILNYHFESPSLLMFKFLLDSDYRKLYNQLESMQLFSNTLPIKVVDYQQYFHHLVIIDPSIGKQLDTVPIDKLTPIKIIKAMCFIHCWLQTTCVIEDPEVVLDFINTLLNQIDELVVKTKKERTSSELKMSQSRMIGKNKTGQRFKQLESSKEVYLLEQICKPYLYYLQKLISRFDFYNSLKKNFIKPMNHSEIWVLVNLFHCIAKVITSIPTICKFIRKSYRPIAESIGLVFSQDVANFYPKLYKYCYREVNKAKSVFFQVENERGEEEAYRRCVENVDLMANLLEEVQEINNGLQGVFQQPVIQHLYEVYFPKMVEIEAVEFEFIRHLEKVKKNGYLHCLEDSVTPKFRTVVVPTFKTEEAEKDEVREEEREDVRGKDMRKDSELSNIFRDISNEDCFEAGEKGVLTVPLRCRFSKQTKQCKQTKEAKQSNKQQSSTRSSHQQHRRIPTLGKPSEI